MGVNMGKIKNNQSVMMRDTIIYMISKGVEIVISVVMASLMTYLFAAKKLGTFSVFNIIITVLGTVLIQWLAQSSLRFAGKYSSGKNSTNFFSTIYNVWLKINVISVLLVVIFLVLVNSNLFSYINFISEYNMVIIFGLLWFITYNTSQLVTSLLVAFRKSRLNLLLSTITVLGKLILIYVFCSLWGSKIEWIFLSYFIADGIVSLIGILNLKLLDKVKNGDSSKEILKELKLYGKPLMWNMLTTSILNKSDVLLISLFLGVSSAGIYQTNYSLVATTFTMLSMAIMRGSYPTVLCVWNEGNNELANKLISNTVRFYLIISVPAVVGIGLLSDVIAKVLYASEYFEGHFVMFWVALGMMLLGLCEYNIKPWELNSKSIDIFKRNLISAIVNVILNLILVPICGYMVAAVTTFLGYLLYFVLSRIGTRKYTQWSLPLITYIRIAGSALIMALIIYIFKRLFIINIMTLFLLIIMGVIVYGILLLIFGEIKEEFEKIKEIVKFKKRSL